MVKDITTLLVSIIFQRKMFLLEAWDNTCNHHEENSGNILLENLHV